MDYGQLNQLSTTDLSNLDGNEQNIKYNIVLRFLNCFGYDKLDLEHAAQGSRIDINIGNKIIVETKALNKNLDKYISQVQEYCNRERPNLALLTNGKIYRFYSPFMRVSDFTDTLIYEFELSDFSNKVITDRIYKIIGFENFSDDSYLSYIEERETELKQVRKLIADFENKKQENIRSIKKEISQIRSEIERLQSEMDLKEQEITQIKSKRAPEKEELFERHFIPKLKIIENVKIDLKQHQRVITQPEKIDNTRIYEIENFKGDVKGMGKFYDSTKFTVLINSKVSQNLDPTFGNGAADGAYKLRMDLEKNGIINSQGIFTEDYTFNSISQAACVVLGGSRNGWKEWK